MRTSHRLALVLIAVALVAGCSSDKPASPTAPPASPVTPAPPAPPLPGAALSIVLSRGVAEVNSEQPVEIVVTGQRTDNWTNLPDGTQVTLTTTLGGLGSQGGPGQVTLNLYNGRATTVLFPGAVLGTATLRAEKAADASFGFAAAEAQVRFVSETQNPLFISSVTPSIGSPTGGETVDILGGGFDPPVRVSFAGNLSANVLNVTDSRITVQTPRLPDSQLPPAGGTVPVSVTVTINYGEQEQDSDTLPNGFTYAYNGGVLQPTILSVTPASGPNEGGTEIVLTGDGFESPLKVEFGGLDNQWLEAQVTSVSRTRIVTISPAASGFGQFMLNRVVSIRVTNLGTGRATTAVNSFRYGVQVLITAIAPGRGPYTGGTLVTIYGQGFDEPVAVTMASFAQQVVSVSGTEVVVRTVRIRPSGCNDVTGPTSLVNIETGNGATGPNFTYDVDAPLITSISPTTGPQGGGTTVTIRGDDFVDPSRVLFVIGGQEYSAAVQGYSGCDSAGICTTMVVVSPAVPNGAFGETDCDDNNDGTKGKKYIATPATLRVTNLETNCTASFNNAFTYTPADTTCRGDVAAP